jgi:hypothetical protein
VVGVSCFKRPCCHTNILFLSYKSIVYKAEITTTDVGETKEYIGMTAGTFKARYANLDLCKAFDTVDHAILIKKLSNYGIQDKALEWSKSYLFNREQYCKVNIEQHRPLGS